MDIALLDELEDEHRQVEDIFAKLEEAEEPAEQEELTRQLVTALTEHMHKEEQEVYPVLVELDAELSTEAEIEHGLARDGMDQMQALVGQPGFGAAVAMVKAGIGHHVSEEEQEAFPMLRSALDPSSQTKSELYDQAQQAEIPGRSHMSKDELAAALGAQ